MHLLDLEIGMDRATACERFILAHYGRNGPVELIVNRLRDPGRVEEKLTRANQHRVKIKLAKSGVERELMALCQQNYDYRVSLDTGMR